MGCGLLRGNVHEDRVVRLPSGDACVAEAQVEAQRNWGAFIEAVDSGLGRSYAVKVPLRDGGEVEHMWLAPTFVRPHTVSGILMGVPRDLGDVKEGDVIEVAVSEVEDWVYWRADGTQVAFYSARCFGQPNSSEGGR